MLTTRKMQRIFAAARVQHQCYTWPHTLLHVTLQETLSRSTFTQKSVMSSLHCYAGWTHTISQGETLGKKQTDAML